MLNLNERLRELRVKFGYTQSQIAQLLNIDRSTYAYYETGKTRPDIASLLRLSHIYSISVNDFMGDEIVPKAVADRRYVSDYVRGKKNSSHIYDLTPMEKELVGAFRICSDEEKEQVLQYIFERIKKHDLPPRIIHKRSGK